MVHLNLRKEHVGPETGFLVAELLGGGAPVPQPADLPRVPQVDIPVEEPEDPEEIPTISPDIGDPPAEKPDSPIRLPGR